MADGDTVGLGSSGGGSSSLFSSPLSLGNVGTAAAGGAGLAGLFYLRRDRTALGIWCHRQQCGHIGK